MLNSTKHLKVVLDLPYYTERKKALVEWVCKRLSIPRESWSPVYCYDFRKKEELPKTKKERSKVVSKKLEVIEPKPDESSYPYVLVGLGEFACEYLLGASRVGTKAGTYWDTKKYGKVWISWSPDRALYDPGLVVQISRVIRLAAREAGIETKFNPNIPMFQWEEYELKQHKYR
jgi:hypothetical protein